MDDPRSNKQVNEYSPFSSIPGEILERRSIVKAISGISVTLLVYTLLSGNLYNAMHAVLKHSGIDFSGGTAQIVEQLCFLLSYALTYLIPTLALYFILGYNFKFSKMFRIPNRAILTYSLPITMSAAVIAGVGVYSLQSLLSFFRIYVLEQASVRPDNAVAYVLFVISRTIVPAFFEEMYFRGVMLHGLRRHGDTFAILVSSMLFAMAHKTLFSAIYAFIVGLVIAYFVIRTGSLLTGIILHFANNSLTLLIEYFEYGFGSQLIIALTYIIILVFGVICITVFVNRDPNIFVLHDKKSHLSNSDKMRYACGNIFFIAVIFIFAINIMSAFTVV